MWVRADLILIVWDVAAVSLLISSFCLYPLFFVDFLLIVHFVLYGALPCARCILFVVV